MSEESAVDKIKEKLHRALKSKAVLSERSKQLAKQVEDFQKREDQTEQVLSELLERQRELNFMLHRSNSVLYRIQEANAVLSTEFTELVKELPAPNAPDWEERVNRINDLFKKTGSMADEMQEDVFKKGIDTDISSSRTDSTESKPSSEEPVTIEPEPENEPEQENIPSAEFTDSAGTLDSEPENEGQYDPVIIDAQFSDPDPVDPNMRKRLDRLFGQAGVDTHKKPAGDSIDGCDKPGFLSQLWGKLFDKDKNNGNHKGEDIIQKEPEMIEPEPDPDSDPEPSVEKAVDELVNDIAEPQQAAVAELSGLLDDTADEVEHIFMDLIPEYNRGTEYPGSDRASEPADRHKSFWSNLFAKINEERRKRALAAIERVTEKRAHRHSNAHV